MSCAKHCLTVSDRIHGDIVDADQLDIDFVKHGLIVLGKNLFNKGDRAIRVY